MRRSPRNLRVACDHRGLTHFGGIYFFHEFLQLLQLRDFLARQPVAWLGQLVTRLEKKGAPAFYRALVDLTRAFTGDDLAYLRSLVGQERGQSALAAYR